MKKLKECSFDELDKLTNSNMSETTGGVYIGNQFPNPDNQIKVNINHDPIKVTGISTGRRF